MSRQLTDFLLKGGRLIDPAGGKDGMFDIRVRDGRRTQSPHTLNGTAVAVGRMIIALLENGQREDGSVELPAVLAEHGAPARLAAAAGERARP